MEEYLVTPDEGVEVGFPIRLTDAYYRRNAENEARHLHVTSLCIVTVGGRALIIDKRIKNEKKGKIVPRCQIAALDLAGSGHAVRIDKMEFYSFEDARRDALKEISEEIYLNGEPIGADVGKLDFIGFAGYCGETNREISCVWSFEIPAELADLLTCRDSVYIDGVETDFELPSYLLPPAEIRELYALSKRTGAVRVEDGLGRLLAEDCGGDFFKTARGKTENE